MSRRERETRVSLDRLSEEQLSILREGASNLLLGKAEDLESLGNEDAPERVIEEVAALARLTSGLEQGEIFVPDRQVGELVRRFTTETINLEELKREYDRELAEHEAWLALLEHFSSEGRRG